MRTRYIALITLALLATPATVSTVAHAQSDDPSITDAARQRFQEGVELFDKGKYEEARASFLQAYALKPHPTVLLNLAYSEVRCGRPVDAARHFTEFLRNNPNAPKAERDSATQGLSQARFYTARLEIKSDVTNAEVIIDGVVVGRTPLRDPIDVNPGTRNVEVRPQDKRGKTVSANAILRQVETVNIYFNSAPPPPVVTPPKTQPEPPPPPPPTDPQQQPEVTDEPDQQPPPDTTQSTSSFTTQGRKPFVRWVIDDKVAWVSSGLTVVGLGVGIGFAIGAASQNNRVNTTADQIMAEAKDKNVTNAPCYNPTPYFAPACSRLKDEMNTRDTYKNVSIGGFVVAGVGAVGTGVLYFVRTSPKTKTAQANSTNTAYTSPPTIMSPIVTPQFQGLSLSGTF